MTTPTMIYDNLAKAQRAGISEEVALTPRQAADWEKCRTAIVYQTPAFAHVFYTLMNPRGTDNLAVFTKEVPIAATDGVCLYLNPDTFFAFPLSQQVFIVVHEILHNIFDHCGLLHAYKHRQQITYKDGTALPYDPEQMNHAADYVINDMLITDGIGKMPQRDGKDVGLHDRSKGTADDSVIDVYRKIYKQQIGGGGGGFDVLLPPGTSAGKDPTSAQQQRNPQQWAQAVQQGMDIAKSQGKLPATMKRLLGEVIDPQVPWQEHILALFNRKVGSGSYDWRRPDRRAITRDDAVYLPGRSGFGAGTVIVAVDTSGSITDKVINMFFGEMAGILEDVRPKRLVVMWCDARVHRVDEVEEAIGLAELRKKGAPGGGGTMFEPVFEEVTSKGYENIDALVYLTDDYGSFPKAQPRYPVIWGSIDCKPEVYPFGDVVMIKE